MKKILLIDGLSIANRAFYGIPLLSNKDGRYTNAVYGFLNIMLSIVEKEKPDLLGVAFDVSAPTFRHIKCETYKGTRKGMPPELRTQIPILKEVLNVMNIEMLECEGFEADDILGTLAREYEAKGYHVVVVSGDRDLLQLASEHVEIKIPKTKQGGTEIESYYAKDVIEKYDVTPLEFIDVKGLMGDSSDNIKGVPGVGEKTAVKLIKSYGSIEGIYAHIEEITQKKLKENLVTYEALAYESKMLATIVCDVPISRQEEDFEYSLVLSEEAVNLFKELEFKKLIQKMQVAERRATNTVETTKETVSLEEFLQQDLDFACSWIVENNHCALATYNGSTIGYGLLDWTQEEDQTLLKKVFTTCEKLRICHDTKSLRHQLYGMNLSLQGMVFDTFLAAYLCSPTDDSYTIRILAETFLDNDDVMERTDVFGKGRTQKSITEIDVQQMKQLLINEVETLFQIYPLFKEKLAVEEMTSLYDDIELPLAEVLFDMEVEGITIDPDKLVQYGQMLQERMEVTASKIYEIAGERFNINSPKQLGTILFEKMDIPPVKKTKTGYSTAADVLETLKVDYPIVEDILAYRQYSKLNSTYVEGLLAVKTADNKIHSTFNQTITATGRISSTEPNLQNIPIKLELGKKIREVFIPKSEDYVFLDADYSQIELRVLAAMAEDDVLIKAFNEEMDIHRLTASQVFHIPFDEVTPLQRSNAKAVNFGIVYGIGAFSLAQDLGITQKEASEYIDNYFEKYPKIKKFLNKVVSEAKLYGAVETLYHRKREIPEIHSANHNLREFGRRKAMNTPIQGTAADIIKIAMIRVHQRLKSEQLKSKLILTVHDELLLEVYKPEEKVVAELLQYEMEHATDLAVKLSVDVHRGDNWLAAK